MKNYFFLISLLVGVLLSAGCKKYLDLKSNLKLVTPQSLKDLQGILDDADKMNLRNTPSLGESSADDFFMLPVNLLSQSALNQQVYQWQPFDIRYGNDWNLAYLAIYNANLTLELLEKVQRTPANVQAWDNVKGSALFLRSFHFLNLVTQYAKVYDESTAGTDQGIVLRTVSDFNVPSVRSSVREAYDQVISDLKTSLSLLPSYAQTNVRPSKGAALALLARAYLFMGNYKEAESFASEALKINAELMDYNGDPSIGSFGATVSVRRLNAETIFYAEQALSIVMHSNTRSRIDSNLVLQYGPADLRKTVFFNMISGYAQFKGSYTGSANIFFSGLATDELYLIRAESNAFLGNYSLAIADLNTLLKKRWNKAIPFMPITAASKEEALAKVRLERRKELLMRSLRWIDLKRYNREGENITIYRNINGKIFSLAPGSPHYALPLPVDVIERSGIPQN